MGWPEGPRPHAHWEQRGLWKERWSRDKWQGLNSAKRGCDPARPHAGDSRASLGHLAKQPTSPASSSSGHAGSGLATCTHSTKAQLQGCTIGCLGRACMQVAVTMQTTRRADHSRLMTVTQGGHPAPKRDTRMCPPGSCRSAYQTTQIHLLGTEPSNHVCTHPRPGGA